MIDKLKKLKDKKIMQEYAFVKSDLEYKQTVLEENRSQFLEKAYLLIGEDRLDLFSSQESAKNYRGSQEKKDWLDYEKGIYTKAKKIYWEISKLTHPDKDINGLYSELFNRAALAYDNCEIFELYEICDKLGINYEIGEEEEKLIKIEILKKKDKVKIIEHSFAYMWSVFDDDESRELVLHRFVVATKGKL